MSLEHTLVKLELFHNLVKEWVSPESMPRILWVHRATVYRWIRLHRQKGIREFKKDYALAKKGRRCRKRTSGYVRGLVMDIRRNYRDCCGEKIAYFLKRDYSVTISQSTIYRILHSNLKLSKRWKRHPWWTIMPRWEYPEHVVQVDTVMLWSLYAFTAVDTFTRRMYTEIRSSLTSRDGREFTENLLKYFPKLFLLQRDGGSEFKGECDAHLRRIGIHVRTSRPYKKNEQAFIERFNGVLRKECVGHIHYHLKDLPQLRARVQSFSTFYHTQRPHISLSYLTPTEFTAQWHKEHPGTQQQGET